MGNNPLRFRVQKHQQAVSWKERRWYFTMETTNRTTPKSTLDVIKEIDPSSWSYYRYSLHWTWTKRLNWSDMKLKDNILKLIYNNFQNGYFPNFWCTMIHTLHLTKLSILLLLFVIVITFPSWIWKQMHIKVARFFPASMTTKRAERNEGRKKWGNILISKHRIPN